LHALAFDFQLPRLLCCHVLTAQTHENITYLWIICPLQQQSPCHKTEIRRESWFLNWL
jgi:hypothetical protein